MKTYRMNYTEMAYGVYYLDAESPEEAYVRMLNGEGESETYDYDNFELMSDTLHCIDDKEDVDIWKLNTDEWEELYDAHLKFLADQKDIFEVDPGVTRIEEMGRREKMATAYANKHFNKELA